MNRNSLGPKTMAIVRLVAMAISWVSLLLTTQFGWEPLPFTDEQINTGVMVAFTVGTSLWGWYKNNPVTHYGVTKETKGVSEIGSRQEFKHEQTNKNIDEGEV